MNMTLSLAPLVSLIAAGGVETITTVAGAANARF